ncbi:MAG: hypothetical protein HDR04_03705 [Lachnospiraceae bacterium]|nr:hypothetical protein [Lachnospiraceae bacterium]
MILFLWVASCIVCVLLGHYLGDRKIKKKVRSILSKKTERQVASDYRADLLNKWLVAEKKNINILSIFNNIETENIGIYGYGIAGKQLVNDMKDAQIKITCIIDRNAHNLGCDYPIYTLDDELPELDMIIVTSVNLNEVKNHIKQENCKIILLRDILELAIEREQRSGGK